MNRSQLSPLACLVLFPACSALAVSGSAAPTVTSACELLTADEIASAQGERPQQSTPSGATQDGLLVSQCYFGLPTPSKSISLTLTTRGNRKTDPDPREFWKATFHHDKDKDRDRKGHGGEEDEKGPALTRVAGLGDEAFWSPSPVGGSLYVLKHHRFIRISVGGPGDRAQKIDKCKTLARSALKRLP